MAGFRLAPKAAQARRNPWQRRRLNLGGPSYFTRAIEDGFTLLDGTYFPSGGVYRVTWTAAYVRSLSDGFTLSDAVVGANPSSGTASAGLIFLFSQGTSGSAFTRSATDGFTISDSAGGSLAPVATSSYSRSATDGFVVSDAVSGSVVELGADATLVGVDLEFTALLETELVFVGE